MDNLPVICSKARVGEARAAAAMLSAVDASLLLSEMVKEDKMAYLLTADGVKKTTVYSKDLKYVLVTAYGSGGSYTAVILARE
jgi:3-oxoacyl-[acyl-carrier-protein] synthase II